MYMAQPPGYEEGGPHIVPAMKKVDRTLRPQASIESLAQQVEDSARAHGILRVRNRPWLVYQEHGGR